jgi:hypothetical protein
MTIIQDHSARRTHSQKETTMTDLEPYYARDRRVYDGALCSDMQRESDHSRRVHQN